MDFKIVENISVIPGNVYYKDKNGAYLWCNEGQLQTLGFTALKQILGKTDFDFLDYETASKVRAVDLRVMTTGNPEIIEEDGNFGNLRVTLSYKAPLKNSAGEIIGIMGNSINMASQRAWNRQIMQESYTKKTALDNVLVYLPGHIYWKDINGVILGGNDKQAACFGLKSSKEFIGKTLFDFVDKESAQKVRENDLAVMRDDTVYILEEPVKINGKEHIFITHKAPFKDPDTAEVIGILGVSIDITEQKLLEESLRKRTQELTQALESKQRFIRNVCHEIRTPMQPILIMPQCLKEYFYTMSEESKLEFIDCAIGATTRLNDLLTNLLDVSKFQEGKFVVEFKLENLKDLLEEVIQEFHLSHGKIKVTIDSGVQPEILCDKFRLHQVLRNLITNSIRYGSQAKPITISVSNWTEDDTKYIKFSVKDEGIGIPKAERAGIFEPFVQSTLTRSNAGGTGLGLAIAKEIVESHLGRIWVDATQDGEVGTRMSFTVPGHLSRTQPSPPKRAKKKQVELGSIFTSS
jgi:PAS domain S-box-containing protein